MTRLAIGAVRVAENHPARNKTQEMTVAEKKKSFMERCFVEIFGTTAYIVLLHLGQDLAAKFLERRNKDFIPTIRAKSIEELKNKPNSRLPLDKFTAAFDEVIGTETNGLVGRMLNLRKVPWTKDLAGSNLRSLAKRMNIGFEEFKNIAPKALAKNFQFKANRMINIATLLSVFFSAILGGYGIQWLNDNIVNSYLKKRYPEPAPEGFLSLSNGINGHASTTNPFAEFSGRRSV